MFNKINSLALLFGILVGMCSCLANLLVIAASCEMVDLTYSQRKVLCDYALWAVWWCMSLLFLGVDNKYSKILILVPLGLLAVVGFCPEGKPLFVRRSPSLLLQIVNFIFLPVFTLESLKRDSRLQTQQLSKVFWRGQVAWASSAALLLICPWARGYEEHFVWVTAMVLSGYALLSTLAGAFLLFKNHLCIEWRLPTESPHEMSATVLRSEDAQELCL